MLNKLFFGLAVVAVVMLGVGLFGGSSKFGAQTVNYSTSGGSQNLYNNQASLLQDIVAVRAPLAGMLQTTISYRIPAAGVSSSTIASTTVAMGSAITPGDTIFVTMPTSSASLVGNASLPIGVSAKVVASSSVELDFFALASGGGLINATSGFTTSTIVIATLPQASFVAPAALNTVTSTSN